jgi:hypothetical protein
MTAPPAGLCATCRHARRIVSGKGSQFWLCRRSETDPAFPRYPALPVLACTGHEPKSPTAPDRPEPDRTAPPHTD